MPPFENKSTEKKTEPDVTSRRGFLKNVSDAAVVVATGAFGVGEAAAKEVTSFPTTAHYGIRKVQDIDTGGLPLDKAIEKVKKELLDNKTRISILYELTESDIASINDNKDVIFKYSPYGKNLRVYGGSDYGVDNITPTVLGAVTGAVVGAVSVRDKSDKEQGKKFMTTTEVAAISGAVLGAGLFGKGSTMIAGMFQNFFNNIKQKGTPVNQKHINDEMGRLSAINEELGLKLDSYQMLERQEDAVKRKVLR